MRGVAVGFQRGFSGARTFATALRSGSGSLAIDGGVVVGVSAVDVIMALLAGLGVNFTEGSGGDGYEPTEFEGWDTPEDAIGWQAQGGGHHVGFERTGNPGLRADGWKETHYFRTSSQT